MWVKDLTKGSVMAHELFHAAVALLRSRGIPLTDDTEEVVAYLIGWLKIHLMDKVYEKQEKLTKEVLR